MAVAFILRLIALIIIQYYCLSKGLLDIFGDAADNISRGHMMGNYLNGRIKHLPELFGIRFDVYNCHILTYLNVIFFALFEDDIFSLKYLNILCVLLVGWLIYDLTAKIYNSKAGKLAMGIVLFWPTIFLWSITDLKDTHFILAIMGMLWSIDKAISRKKFKSSFLFLILATIFFIYFIGLRFHFRFIALFYFAILAIYFILRWNTKRRLHKGIRLLFLLLVIFCALFLLKEKLYQFTIGLYEASIASNRGFLSSGGINYDLFSNSGDVNIYSVKFFIKFLFRSWFHFMLEPLPWNIASFKMVSIYPFMLFWYFMLLFSVIGIIKICRIGQADRVFSLFMFLVIFITANSMSIANIGTAFRLRDNIVPIVAVLASFSLADLSIIFKK